MPQPTTSSHARVWQDSSHASLCLLCSQLRARGLFRLLDEHTTITQKRLTFTAAQKVQMLFVSLLAGATAVSHTMRTLRVDPALQIASGLPGCADQSVIADTLDAATAADVAALRTGLDAAITRFSQARRHDRTPSLLTLDLDLSPLPASSRAEGSERGSMGRSRSRTGRKLARVRAAASSEILYEAVLPGRTAESLSVVETMVGAVEDLLLMAGESAQAKSRRSRTELRLDSGWGSDAIITWLLARGYQLTGTFQASPRIRRLAAPITDWTATSSPGRDVAAVPEQVEFDRPLAQDAIRTPSKEHASEYYIAILFTTRTDLTMEALVIHYDQRAGMEADLKSDKRGLGLGVLRKGKLAAQTVVVLLGALAHNVLLWSRRWLEPTVPRLAAYGIVRLVREVWAVPGRVKIVAGEVTRVRLRREHPRARDVWLGIRPLLADGQSVGFLG